MKINWFTVIAQIINFLVLVWLLRRFLYKPVLKAIDERENKIASELKDAKVKETEAKKEQSEFLKKNEKFDQQKKKLMDKVIAETNEEREKLLEEARNEAAVLRSKLEKSLNAMQENLEHDIVQKTQEEVFAVARKTLKDLSSMSLEEQSVNIFINRLKELKNEEKKRLIKAFNSGSDLPAGRQGSILVQTAFDLPSKQQTQIESTVNEILGTKPQFQFKTVPELIGGIELTSNGYKLAWSISEYLNSIQKSISETLKTKFKEEPEKMTDTNNKEKKEPKAKQKVQAKTKAKPKTKPAISNQQPATSN
jgi:F-type H+-transporting ATPase subunit b